MRKTIKSRKPIAARKVARPGFDPEMLIGQIDLAKVLGIDQSTISRETYNGVLERVQGQKGPNQSIRYRLGESVRRYHQNDLKAKAESPGETRHRDALSRRASAMAERAELTLAKQKGQLVSLQDVTMFLSDLILRTRSGIMSVPGRIARKVGNKEIVALMRIELQRTLKILSETTAEQATKGLCEPEENEDAKDEIEEADHE